jgi:hypothetical protein
LSERTGSDYAKWILGALVVGVLGSQAVLFRQNLQLRNRVTAQDSVSQQVRMLRTKADRTIYEASMMGRCRPLLDGILAQPRTLDVSLYFSLEHDCMSCVTDLVNQWNDALKGPQASSFRVHGYTEIDGAAARKTIDRDLKPAFPVSHVEHLHDVLATAGVKVSPVVFVSDAATGRILLTHAPLASEKSDGAIVKRVQALLTPCTP